MKMDVRPLRTEADYDWALAEIEPYFIDEPRVGTREPIGSTSSRP
jgi:HTH-type transcriptional regulator/antitoxin HigA